MLSLFNSGWAPFGAKIIIFLYFFCSQMHIFYSFSNFAPL